MRKVAMIVGALLLACGCSQGGVGDVMKAYADGLCACKTMECVSDVQPKYQERIAAESGIARPVSSVSTGTDTGPRQRPNLRRSPSSPTSGA
jgi:hypothetical protein